MDELLSSEMYLNSRLTARRHRWSSKNKGPLAWAQNKLPFVRFEVFTAVTVKNGVFWDVTPSGSRKNRRFRGT
jgi:hypothetical protein